MNTEVAAILIVLLLIEAANRISIENLRRKIENLEDKNDGV